MTIRKAGRNTIAALLATVMLMAAPVQTFADAAETDAAADNTQTVVEVVSESVPEGVYGVDMFAYVLIQPGDSGSDVKTIQRRLTDLGYFTNSVTGNYGTITTDAVKAFQTASGINVDGVVGQQTYEALFAEDAIRADGTAAATAAPTAAPEANVTAAVTADPTAAPTAIVNDTGIAAAQGDIPEFTGVLKNGSYGTAVKNAQLRLKTLGYLSGTADGAFGAATATAVKAFQIKCGLSADGTVNFETHIRLYADDAPANTTVSATATAAPAATPGATYFTDMKYGSTGTAVKNVQRRLIDLGYLKGSADGAYGTATQSAVKAFQSARGLSTTGIVDKATYDALFAADGETATEAPAATATATAFAEISKGMSGDEVSRLQSRLKELGYYAGSLMGNFGELTQVALISFQKTAGLSQTGTLNKATYDAIYSSNAPYKDEDPGDYTELLEGDTGDDVKSLQERLIELGYMTGAANGIFDEATTVAVVTFQKTNGLTADGMATVTTQQKLYSDSAIANAGTVTATPAPTAVPTAVPTATPVPTTYATLKTGSVGAAVKTLQYRLIELGYLAGSADGAYGAKTATAVKSFQIKLGMSATGIADSTTQSEIYRSDAPSKDSTVEVTPMPTATAAVTAAPTVDPNATAVPTAPVTEYTLLKLGATGEAVANLQTKLKELGYYTATVNSVYDDTTASAVKEFQQANSLEVDGAAGKATQECLYSGDALSKSESTVSGPETNYPTEVSGSVKKPVISDIIDMDWFENVDGFFNRTSGTFKIGATAIVTDVKTGICYTVRRLGGTNHADVEPQTAFDAWQMYRVYGKNWSWTRRAIVVTIGGKNIAASMNGMPHGGQALTNNNFIGHSCIHFTNSRTHGTNRVDPDHQAAIKTALAADVSALNARIQAQ